MNQQKLVDGLRDIRTFITADALLAAVLLVWEQLWIQPFVQLWAKWYGVEQTEAITRVLGISNFNVGIGVVWTSIAVCLALLALAVIVWRSLRREIGETHWLALGLFAASLVMAIANVGQSILFVGVKTFKGLQVLEPLPTPGFLIWISILLSVAIVGLSLWGACRLERKRYEGVSWACKYLPWIIEAGLVSVVAVFALGYIFCRIF